MYSLPRISDPLIHAHRPPVASLAPSTDPRPHYTKAWEGGVPGQSPGLVMETPLDAADEAEKKFSFAPKSPAGKRVAA